MYMKADLAQRSAAAAGQVESWANNPGTAPEATVRKLTSNAGQNLDRACC